MMKQIRVHIEVDMLAEDAKDASLSAVKNFIRPEHVRFVRAVLAGDAIPEPNMPVLLDTIDPEIWKSLIPPAEPAPVPVPLKQYEVEGTIHLVVGLNKRVLAASKDQAREAAITLVQDEANWEDPSLDEICISSVIEIMADAENA